MIRKSYYDTWIDEQAKVVEAGMRSHTTGANAAVYVIPSSGPIPGKLVVADFEPEGSVAVVRFPAQGTEVKWVPYSHLRSLLWSGCRSFPILPVPTPEG